MDGDVRRKMRRTLGDNDKLYRVELDFVSLGGKWVAMWRLF